MKKSELIQIIKEEVHNVISESPDRTLDGLGYDSSDAIAFILHHDKIYIAGNPTYNHDGDIIWKTHGDISSNYPGERLKFNFDNTSGRIWTDNRKISFWNLHTKYKPKIVDMINKELTLKRSDIQIDNSWKIELCDIWKCEDTGMAKDTSVYFPINEFTTSKIDYNQYKASWRPILNYPNCTPYFLRRIRRDFEKHELS